MFLIVLLKEGSHFHLLFENLLENKPKYSMNFCLKTPDLTISVCSKCQTTYKIILVTAIDIQYKLQKLLLLRMATK